MTNNLKFRQFIPTDLHPEGEFIYWGYGVIDMGDGFVAPADHKAPSEQWIGLHDRNGIKIYVGDIISGMMYDKKHPNNTSVVFDKRYAIYKGQNGTELIPLGYECKIIGNVHENPELLK